MKLRLPRRPTPARAARVPGEGPPQPPARRAAPGWSSRRGARVLALAVGVALLFVEWLATSYAFDRTVEAVEVVFDEAVPSIAHLAEAQGVLAELGQELRHLGDPAAPPVDPAWQVEQKARALLRTARRLVAQYEGVPMQPEEHEAHADLRAALDALSAATLAMTAERDPDARHRRWVEGFLPAYDANVAALRDLVEVNAAQASRAARGTIEAHEAAGRSSLALTIGLNGLLVALWVLLDRQIARAEREREARLAELDSFAGRVAHDLKGPLSIMLLAVQLARRDAALPEPSARALERAERAATRMSTLIDGLLAFAKAGAAADPAARARVADVLASIRATAGPAIQAQGVAVELDVAPDLMARTAEGVLASIVQNLLRNAVLHMGESPVRRVRVRARAVSPRTLELEVSDTGPGIPDDVKRRLFRPFERGSTSGEGHGLGLATVKRLVEGHGGSISVDTELGRGTTFRVRLPRA